MQVDLCTSYRVAQTQWYQIQEDQKMTKTVICWGSKFSGEDQTFQKNWSGGPKFSVKK